MARQNITPNPSLKMFEAYMDFSGGRNSETSNERLRDNEFPTLDNVDLSSRGSAKRRHGRRLLANQSGRGQGVFFFYRQGQEKPDIIMAINGALFVLENGATVTKPIQIMDGTTPFFFQNQRPIEAVQYGTDMFIATGTKFCELTYIDAPLWLPETQYNVGDRVKAGGRVYECIVAGTSGTIAPTHVDTTNLLTENQSSVETDLTGFASYRGATLTRETTVAWHGSASLKVTTPGAQVTEGVVLPSFDVAPGQAYTASVYVRGSGAVKLFLHERDSNDAIIGITTSEVMQLTDSWQRVSVTRVFGATGTKLRFYVLTEGTAAIEFWVDGLQLEAKPYATSWQIGGTARAAETLTVPTTGLSPTQGCWRQWVYVDAVARRTTGFNRVFEIPRTGNDGGIVLFHSGGSSNWAVQSYNDENATFLATFADSVTPDGWHMFEVKWKASEVKVFVDGVLRATLANPNLSTAFHTTAYVGMSRFGADHLNTLHGPIQLLSTYPTDAESAAVYAAGIGGMVWDDNTTALFRWDNSLSTALRLNKTWRQGHTWGISGEIKVAVGDTDFLNPFFVSLAQDQTAKIAKVMYRINSGTSAQVKLQKNGVDVPGYDAITLTTTDTTLDVTDVDLADGDKISLVVTSVTGAPKNMSFTLFIDHSM